MELIQFFFQTLLASEEARRELTCNPIISQYDGEEVTDGVVYEIYMTHWRLLPSELVKPEVAQAMYDEFDRGEWKGKLSRPSILEISAARRSQLRPILRLS